MKRLFVYLNHNYAGVLSQNDGAWSFKYHHVRLSPGSYDGLSPALPVRRLAYRDRPWSRPVQDFFENLLPEEGSLEIAYAGMRPKCDDTFDLLGQLGSEAAGAVRIFPDRLGDLQPLSGTIPTTSSMSTDLNVTATCLNTVALAGAQPKVALRKSGNIRYLPSYEGLSNQILKPDHPNVDLYPHTAINELFCMRLASLMGLFVPKIKLLSLPGPVFCSDRFDRVAGRQIHAIDGCQALSVSSSLKYKLSSVDSLRKLASLCSNPEKASSDIFVWVVFNTLIGNDDAHLKNLSFFYDGYRLKPAPHYDILSTTVYAPGNKWLESSYPWTGGDIAIFGDVTRLALVNIGVGLGLEASKAESLLDWMLFLIDEKSLTLLNCIAANADAGSCRLLRQIHYGVITDMIGKLKL